MFALRTGTTSFAFALGFLGSMFVLCKVGLFPECRISTEVTFYEVLLPIVLVLLLLTSMGFLVTFVVDQTSLRVAGFPVWIQRLCVLVAGAAISILPLALWELGGYLSAMSSISIVPIFLVHAGYIPLIGGGFVTAGTALVWTKQSGLDSRHHAP